MKVLLTLLLIITANGLYAQPKKDLEKVLNGLPGNWEGQYAYRVQPGDTNFKLLPAVVSIKGSGKDLMMQYRYTEANGKVMNNPGGLQILFEENLAVYDGKEYAIMAIQRKGVRVTLILLREADESSNDLSTKQTLTFSPGTLNILKESADTVTGKFFVKSRLTLRKK